MVRDKRHRVAPVLPSFVHAGEAALGLFSSSWKRDADALAVGSQLSRVEAMIKELQADHDRYHESARFIFDNCDPVYFELLERRRHHARPLPREVVDQLEERVGEFKASHKV